MLDELGAMIVAAELGANPDKSRWRADKALAIGKSQRLAHLVGLNGFFSALLAESHCRADGDLSPWWSERHCANQFDRIAQPDGLGVWEDAGDRVGLCLECDRSIGGWRSSDKGIGGSAGDVVEAAPAGWLALRSEHPH